ncbi:carbonic anhydrase [Leucobacter exalbidus]|uniref:carbonic anhydrase n=1 Tax=Leucobacter exalbidus TaxID=662960 RepID=A0A940PKS3_9MICO|nr:carbonic anhydrase [Leucobacter exalbidus]MBP1325747.1 carbonic anhydrase [Leucobacter exalbidus]
MKSPRVTPQQAWDALSAGNERFMNDTLRHNNQDTDRRHELASGQAPDAAFLGCADSRVAAEMLFDCGLGDLFVARNIGQVANMNMVATLEYAVAMLGAAVIVVLAHDSCGAVAAAIEQTTARPPQVTEAIKDELSLIQPSVQQVWFKEHRDTPYVDPDQIDANAVGRRHLVTTINQLIRSSRVLSDAVAEGRLGIVGCQYQLHNGRVAPVSSVGKLDIELTAFA